MPIDKESFARILLGIGNQLLVLLGQARRAIGWEGSLLALSFGEYEFYNWYTIGRKNGLRPAVEMVRILYGGVCQFEKRNSVSGWDLAHVYSFFRKGSQPRGVSWVIRPFFPRSSTSRSRVIFPIADRRTPRKDFGRSFARRGGTVNNNS